MISVSIHIIQVFSWVRIPCLLTGFRAVLSGPLVNWSCFYVHVIVIYWVWWCPVFLKLNFTIISMKNKVLSYIILSCVHYLRVYLHYFLVLLNFHWHHHADDTNDKLALKPLYKCSCYFILQSAIALLIFTFCVYD